MDEFMTQQEFTKEWRSLWMNYEMSVTSDDIADMLLN